MLLSDLVGLSVMDLLKLHVRFVWTVCVFVLVFHTSAVFYLQLWAQVKSRVK